MMILIKYKYESYCVLGNAAGSILIDFDYLLEHFLLNTLF